MAPGFGNALAWSDAGRTETGDSPAGIFYLRKRQTLLQTRTTMAEHKHGEMDVTEHEKTFEGFIRWTIYVAAFSIAVLIFLAIFNS
jgi:hypothetical protein